MTTATKDEQIAEAEQRKTNTAQLLEEAFSILNEAQNQITNVEGKGSANIYDGIADAYQAVAKLGEQTRRMRATGLFC